MHWIEVNLTLQVLNAYEGQKLVRTAFVSTGTQDNPTPTGLFRIHTKMRYDDMQGPDYYLPNVPYVMYFHGGYGLHGTYWHANFGHRMSHGCVNIPTAHAQWLFDFTLVGDPAEFTGSTFPVQAYQTFGCWTYSWQEWQALGALI